jgi:Predicted O-methyltransferase
MLVQEKKSELFSELMLIDLDTQRLNFSKSTDKQIKLQLGQFFTDPRIALFMSKMFEAHVPHVNLLDPGAGMGNLTAAVITQICKRQNKPSNIEATVVELDKNLIQHLERTLEFCNRLCVINNIKFHYNIVQDDFIDYGVSHLKSNSGLVFNMIITNPPYKKINSNSKTRLKLREVGIETTNLYTAFVAIAKRMLEQGGELVAITPRSFCNGTYFRSFREDFLSDMRFKKIHLFKSRTDSFKDDEVLQENIIYHAIKDGINNEVQISYSESIEDTGASHTIEYSKLVHPNDADRFIRILRDKADIQIKQTVEKITSSLNELSINVSTGRVVDFRTASNLRNTPSENTVPLIYPAHFNNGFLRWPLPTINKPNAIALNESTLKLLVPKGYYVLVRRFSSNEEKKRIIPAIYDPTKFDADFVGFENHINYYHCNGQGIPLDLAKGLALYLNSTIVDRYFRQFNGHTQVNVGDLRSLPYPTKAELINMGLLFGDSFPNQQETDQIVNTVLGIS